MGEPRSLPLPAPNLYRLFADRARKKPAFRQFWNKQGGLWQGQTLSEVRSRALKIASRLSRLGLKPGDRAAICAENSLDWVAADMGILALGGVVVPIYPTSTAEEAAFILRDSGASIVFTAGAERTAALAGLGQDKVKTLISFDGSTSGRVQGLAEIYKEPEALEGLDREGMASSSDALATIVYTSGTSGRPKGVELSHRNILSNVAGALEAFPLGEEDRCLSFLPLSHMFERTAGYYVMLAAGVSIYYAESTDQVPANLREVGPTVVISVPRLYEKVYARIKAGAAEGPAVKRKIAEFGFHTASSLARAWEQGKKPGLALKAAAWLAGVLVFKKIRARVGGKLKWFISGGAPLTPDIARFFFGVGIPIQEGYGLTETAPIIACNRPGQIRFGTVGPPLADVEVRIAEDGEILCRGPLVMKGYLNLPQETGEALAGGWFHTGDIGILDEAGYLRITDRKKALLVLATGKKVAPAEVEAALKRDPLFAQVVPWGDNRPFMTALVVPDCARLASLLERPAPRSAAEKEALCADPRAGEAVMAQVEKLMTELAPFKHVKKVFLYPAELTQEDGSLTPTLKIKTRVIQERFGSRLDALYEGHV